MFRIGYAELSLQYKHKIESAYNPGSVATNPQWLSSLFSGKSRQPTVTKSFIMQLSVLPCQY